MFARQADRIDTPWHWEQDGFKADVAGPVSAKVVHIPESLTAMEAQVAQEDTTRLRPTAAILSAMDLEAVQMLVAPVKHHLEDVVKMCQSGIAAHEETAPDEGADPSEDDTQLVDAGRCTGLAHGQSVPRKTLCFKVSPRNLALSIESAHAQGIRRCGLRQARYVGLAKTHLQHLATAAALNFVRLGEWLTGTPRAKTRCSPFAALKAA